MGTQGPGRKRIPNREKLTAEDDALNQIAREAEARLAAKRAARAEARDIRMKELERQQKERYYGLDSKWGHIEQWMEDSERYSRHSRRHTSMSDDEERMSVGSRGSLRPSDYSGFFGSGSRTSSRASSARASPVVEERPDRDFADKGARTASTLSAATLASLGGASSRRGSCDTSFSVETEASIRDMKDSLAEAEEKYRKAMVSNAQLHNEKSALMYQVETLKEELGDTEELLWESRRHCDDRSKECERERQAHRVLQFQFKEMEETLRQTEALLTEVSELRMKSSSYCQEVSDLQEVLQWKEKKMAALERQREISDIVRLERDRLRGDVVRLRDLLKEHGVDVEVSTNGETALGDAEDDVSAESASRLAQETSPAGRESMLGKVRKRQPAEGSDRSQSRNTRPTRDQTEMQALKQVKGSDEPARGRAAKRTRRNKNARKLPRNKGSKMDPTRKFHLRRKGKTLVGNEGLPKAPMEKELGTWEPKSSIARFTVEDQAFKGIKKTKVSVASNRDALAKEMERSFDQICKYQTNVRGSQPLVHLSGNQEKCVDLVLPVCRTSTEKVCKSSLVPPPPRKDILDNQVMVSNVMATGKLNSLTQEKQEGTGTPSSDRDAAQRPSSAVDQISQNPEKGGDTCRDVRCSEGGVVPDRPGLGAKENPVKEFSTPTLVVNLKENEFVDQVAENDDDEWDGRSLEEEVLANLVENETVLTMCESSQRTLQEDKSLKNGGALRCSAVSEGPNLETRVKPSETDAFLPAEEAITEGTSGTTENWRTMVRKGIYSQEKTQDNPSECPSEGPECPFERPVCPSKRPSECPSERPPRSSECPAPSSGRSSERPVSPSERPVCPSERPKRPSERPPRSSECPAPSSGRSSERPGRPSERPRPSSRRPSEHPGCNDQTQTSKSSMRFVPVEMWKDWSGLKKNIQRVLKGFGEKTSLASKTSRNLPDVGKSLNRRISDFEDSLKTVLEHVSDQRETGDQESTEGPESGDQRASGHWTIIGDGPVSEMFDIASLEDCPQTHPREVIEDAQEPRAREDQDTTGSSPRTYNLTVKVSDSFPEESSVDVEDEEPSQSDPLAMSWSEEIVFVEFYFAEPAKPKRVPVEEVDTRPSRRRTPSANSPTSTVRRILEMTAEEIRAMAAPELLLTSLQDGVVEDQRVIESTGRTTEDQELSVGDLDSCEEVGEEAAAARQPAAEAGDDVSVENLRKRRGLGSHGRKHQHTPDCKTS